MAEDLPHRQPRGHYVADLAMAAIVPGAIDAGREDDAIAGQQRGQLGHLIAAGVAGHVGETARDLLQADHIGIGHALHGVDDAGEVDLAVRPAPPLDIPRNQFHRLPCIAAAVWRRDWNTIALSQNNTSGPTGVSSRVFIRPPGDAVECRFRHNSGVSRTGCQDRKPRHGGARRRPPGQ
ncbi:hypothetical protein D3C81_1373170 [compost metagenome]